MFKYMQSELPDSEMVADALTVLEGTQPPEWQANRAKQRHNALREKVRTRLGYGHDSGPIPQWEWNAILSAAKQRRDVLAAAIASCEQDCDGKEQIATELGNYLKGEHSITWIETVMNRLGLAVEGAKIIPLAPRRRA
jgi:hypothetical protein